MTDRELTPEADKALEKVYIFLLRKRRERLHDRQIRNSPYMLHQHLQVLLIRK